MFPEYIKEGTRRTPRSEEERRELVRQGFRPVVAINDVDAAGNRIVRSATEQEQREGLFGTPGARALTPEVQAELDRRRSVELRTRDAQSTEEQVRAGASAFGAGATFGLTTMAGLDSRTNLSDESRDILRSQTTGAEIAGYLASAALPFGAEALISRGASFLGTGVRRFAAEGAAGGAFNALQEAQIARDPDVFAERLTSDMGLGTLLGAAVGVPTAGLSRLSRLSRGTAAARATRELEDTLEAISPVRNGDLTVARMEEITQSALSPDSRRGGLMQAFGGASRSNATGAEMQALERMVARQRNRSAADIARSSQSATDLVSGLRQARGRLADVAEASIPTQGIDDMALRGTREELNSLSRTLERMSSQDSAVSSALRELSERMRLSRDATPQQALRQLYNAPRAIADATASLSPRQLDELEGLIQFESVSGNSGLLNGQGLDGLRAGLDDLMTSGSWGEAGQFLGARRRLQQGADEALEPLMSRFEALGTGEIKDANAMGRVLRTAEDSGDVATLERLQGAAAFMDSLPGEANLFPELAQLQGVRGFGDQLADQIQGSYAVATTKRIAQREMEASLVQQSVRQGIGGLGLAGAGAAALGGFGGAAAVGGAAVAGMSLMRSPFGMRRMVARLKNAFDGQTSRLSRSLDRTSQMATSTRRNPFRRLIPRTGTLAHIAVRGSREEKQETYEELTQRINSLMEDPGSMATIMQPQIGGVDEIVPGLGMAMGMQSHRQLAALAAAMPLSARTQRDLARLSAPPMPPNQTEVNEFLQAAAVIEDPVFGVELMNSGRLTAGSARALASAFPNFHEEVTARIISDIAREHHRRRRRPRLNYQASLMMSRFAGFPLDNTMTPEFNQIMSSPAAQTREQDRAQSSRPVSVREPSFLRNESTVLTEIGN